MKASGGEAGITRITNVPTLDQRAGIFADANGMPVTVPVHPVSAALFNLFPQPNLADPSGNFISSPEQRDATDQFLVKVDHHLRSADTLSARYSRTRSDIFFPFTPGQSGTNVPGYGVNDTGANHLVALSYTRVFTPSTLNEARFGFTRRLTKKGLLRSATSWKELGIEAIAIRSSLATRSATTRRGRRNS